MRLIYLFFIITCIGAEIAISQPKLTLNKLEVDLGSIYSGEKKKGKIELKNVGNDTLHIFSVQPTCGCTTIKQPKNFLLPGESDFVEIEFNSTGYHGIVEKHVNIISDDPTSQYVSVKLFGDIKEVLQILSGSKLIWMNNITIGKPSTRIVTLKNVSGSPLVIRGDSVSSASISINMQKETLQPNDTLALQVMVVPDKLGYSNERFYIITNHKIQPRIEILVAYNGIKEN